MSAAASHDERLPERAEALLEGWPAPEKSSLEWEEAANTTMARVREAAPDEATDALLAAPLPVEEGEPTGEPAPKEDEPRLADIARAVVAAGGSAAQKDVAREMLQAASESRRSQGPAAPPAPPSRRDMAPEGAALLQSRVATGATGPASEAKPASGPRPVQTMHEASARSEMPQPQAPAPRRDRAALAVGSAGLALAAGVALFVALRGNGNAPPLSATTEAMPSQAVAAAPAPKAAAPAPRPLALDSLPTPDEARRAELLAQNAAAKETAAATPASRAGEKDNLAFRVQNTPKSANKIVLEEREESAGEAEESDDEDQSNVTKAAKGKTAATSAAEQTDESEPALGHPSLGAVQAAVGSVMMGARSCLAGQEEGSRATVTFGSDGRVKSVAISGPAAGTPAEGCVRSALMAARVPPFSDATFAAGLTVRPP